MHFSHLSFLQKLVDDQENSYGIVRVIMILIKNI